MGYKFRSSESQLVHLVRVLPLLTHCLAVSITTEYREIHVQDGAENITLPCACRNPRDEISRIRWYRGTVDSDDLVLSMNMTGQLYPGENYMDRFNITGQADLVLEYPRRTDSSNYSCEIMIEGDIPAVIDCQVYLRVTETTERNKSLPIVLCIANCVAIIGTLFGASVALSRLWGKLSTGIRVQLIVVSFCVLVPCLLSTGLLILCLRPSYEEFRQPGVVLSVTGVVVTCGTMIAFLVVSCGISHGEIKFHRKGVQLNEPSRHPHNPGERENKKLEEKSKQLRHICEKDRHLFIATGAYHTTKKALTSCNSVLVLGHSGEGKTTILKQLCLEFLEKNYLVLDLDSPDDIGANIPDNKNVLLILDDPFGSVYVVQERVEAWIHRAGSFTNLLKYLECGRVKLVFACRKTIWNQCKESLQNLPIFQRIIDISANGLTADMKQEMILRHLGSESEKIFQPPDWIFKEICEAPDLPGFPQSCRLAAIAGFTPGDENQFVELFLNPLEFIRGGLKRLRTSDPWKYASLVLVMLNNGLLSSEELNNESVEERFKEMLNYVLDSCRILNSARPFGNLRYSLDTLNGSYLVSKTSENGKFYSFSHDCFFEAMTAEYGVENMDQIMKYCDPAFVVSRCRPHNYPRRIEEHLVLLPVREKYYPQFVEVLTGQIRKGTLRRVFANPAVRDDALQDIWIQHLKSLDPTKRFRMITMDIQDKPNQGNLLYHTAKSGAEKLFHYLKTEGARCSPLLDFYPIVGAAEGGFLSLVSALLSWNDKSGDEGQEESLLNYGYRDQIGAIPQALIAAATAGHIEIVELLLNYRVPVKDPEVILLAASENGHTAIVDLILLHDVNLPLVGVKQAYSIAMDHGHKEIADKLRDHLRRARVARIKDRTGNYQCCVF